MNTTTKSNASITLQNINRAKQQLNCYLIQAAESGIPVSLSAHEVSVSSSAHCVLLKMESPHYYWQKKAPDGGLL
jgi:hypothetical protein